MSGILIKPPFGRKPKSAPSRRGLALDLPILGTGDLQDYSLNGNTGTNNGATWSSSEIGAALSFNGSSDFVDGGDVGLTGHPFTLTAVYSTSASVLGAALWVGNTLSSQEYYAIGADSTGVAFLRGRVAGAATDTLGTSTINDGQLHTITGVFISPTERLLYVDGVLENTGTVSVTAATTFDGYALGVLDDSSASNFFSGLISSGMIHNRTISAAEARSLHENPWRAWEKGNIVLWAAISGAAPTTSVNLLDGLLERKRLIA